MFDFELSPAQQQLRDRTREFARAEIEPHVSACDRERRLEPEVAERFHATGIAAGFLAPPLERSFLTDICLVTEELAYACPAFASYLMLPVFFNRLLLTYLSPERAHNLQDELARGPVVTAFSASERAAGSDLRTMAVTATRVAGGFRLDGRKEYSSNARFARYLLLVARGPVAPGSAADEESTTKRTSDGPAGLSWFMVRTDAAGLAFGPRWETLGLRAIDVSPIELSGVLVPADCTLGGEGRGLHLLNEHLAQSRTGIAAVAVGIARRARDLVLEFGGRRRVFGERLTRMQDYRFRIADMERDIAAARSLVGLSARKHDAGHDHGKEASIAKLAAGEMVMRVTEAAVLMLGSAGYTGQSLVEKLFRDARHTAIVEGPEPIHREIVFAELLRRGAY